MSAPASTGGEPAGKPHPLREITQPFVDLVRAPRALWGINVGYLLEGMVYFGMLGYLTIYFSEYVFRGVAQPDVWAHDMVAVLTAGITLSMFFLGFVPDRWGFRLAMLAAFGLLFLGRVLISAAPTVFHMQPNGPWSALHLTTMAGILIVVIGYGMYQPAAYAGVKAVTTPKTAAMGFAMLYALMNLGGWLPTFAFLIRDDRYLGWGIPGAFWVYTGFTLVALVATAALLTRRTADDAVASAQAETARMKAAEAAAAETPAEALAEANVRPEVQSTAAISEVVDGRTRVPPHLWLIWLGAMVLLAFKPEAPYYHTWAEGAWRIVLIGLIFIVPLVITLGPRSWRRWVAEHPLGNAKFFFFIFALIPVQTLFTYNWLVLPPYIARAYDGWIGEKFEIAANANPILIFILVPIVTALTTRANVYNMMIYGTLVMAAPAFLLAIGPYAWTLAAYIVILTIGEAMWQPRFLQYAAEIAPPGKTGVYMGVAQFPWFLTKLLVPLLYSGWMMDKYCPAEGPQDTRTMWLIFACIAMVSPVLLLVAKGWAGKDMQARHAG